MGNLLTICTYWNACLSNISVCHENAKVVLCGSSAVKMINSFLNHCFYVLVQCAIATPAKVEIIKYKCLPFLGKLSKHIFDHLHILLCVWHAQNVLLQLIPLNAFFIFCVVHRGLCRYVVCEAPGSCVCLTGNYSYIDIPAVTVRAGNK